MIQRAPLTNSLLVQEVLFLNCSLFKFIILTYFFFFCLHDVVVTDIYFFKNLGLGSVIGVNQFILWDF